METTTEAAKPGARRITDPVPALIAELLAFEGLAPETRMLIELALEAQKTGSMPDLSGIPA